MTKVPTNISLDAEVKARSQEMLANMGLDLSTAVNIFLRQMLREKAIPFMIREDISYQTTLAAMDDAESGVTHGPFASVSEAMEALNAED